MRTIAAVMQELAVEPEQGLAAAKVALSQKQYGLNHLTPLPRQPLWEKFLEKFEEPIIKILLAAALLEMVVELFAANNWLGGAALGGVLLVVAAAYALQK